MDLQTYQRSLRRLVTGAEPDAGDPPYARELAGSTQLAVVREVIAFWRAQALERYCVLSSSYLKRSGQFDEEIGRFIALGDFSPDIALAGQQFLRHLTASRDALVQAVARLEIALHETRTNPDEVRVLEWPCDPEPVLATILGRGEIKEPLDAAPHRVTVSRALPGGYASEPLPSRVSG